MTLLRLGLSRLAQQSAPAAKKLSLTNLQLHRSIYSVATRDPEVDKFKPPPWPYEKRPYWWHHYFFNLDPTHLHIDENSKIIVVEGNKSCGKEEVCKQIAEYFDFYHMPEITLDELYINTRGFDYRTMNQYLYPRCQAIDEKMYYQDPRHPAVASMFEFMYVQRFLQYSRALEHMLSTGQGVVLERSPWSMFAFADTMEKYGFIAKESNDYFRRLRWMVCYQLLRPHLVIYLDRPAEDCLKKIRERGRPEEVNSEIFKNVDYLKEIETKLKREYLPWIITHSEVLSYDWGDNHDIDEVLEDIERIDFENYDVHLDKMQDWNLWKRDLWEEMRIKYGANRMWLYRDCYIRCPGTFRQLPHRPTDYEDEQGAMILENLVHDYNYYPSFDWKVHGIWKVLFKFTNVSRREKVDDQFFRWRFY